MFNSAILYARKGWYVFPLHDKGKTPLTKTGFKEATIDEKIIREWWNKWPLANIGIATGAISGITVLDVDSKSGGFFSLEEVALAPTPKVKTGGGGEHYYFKYCAEVQTRVGIKPGLDLRSDGGYVVAPPSVHPLGNKYLWCDEDIPLADCPAWMIEKKASAKPIPEVIQQSKRNETLASLAGSMRRRGASIESIEKALLEENKKCVPPLDEKEILAIARSVSRYAPAPSKIKSSEKFIRVAFNEFVLQAQRINKLSTQGIRTTVSIDGPDGKIYGDVVNVSKQESRDKFIKECPVESREDLKKAFVELEQALIDSVNSPQISTDQGNKEFNGLIETESGYVRMGEDGAVNISTGKVEPECRIETKEGEIIKGRIFGQAVYFPRRSWDSKKEWLKNFNSADFHFFGTDYDVQSILGLLTKCYNLPKKKGTEVIGRFFDAFVFPKTTIDKTGIINDPMNIFIPAGSPLENDFLFTRTENKKGLVKVIYENLFNLNRVETVSIVAGMKFAQGFCPEIREACRSFPVLYGYGSSGAGKTTTLNILRRVFGQSARPQAGGKTAFSYLRLGSSTNAVGISLDEIKFADMDKYKKDSLMQFIRWAYDGAMEARGKSDQTMNLYSLLAPVECFGEQFPQEDAVLQRVVPALFLMEGEKTDENKEALNVLDGLDLESFAEIYYSWVLRADFKELFQAATEKTEEFLKDRLVPVRIKRNISVFVFGLLVFEGIGKEYEASFAELNITGALNEILDALITVGGRTKRALDVYIEKLAIMAKWKRLNRGQDYEIGDGVLYFHNASCLDKFRQFARETNFDGEIFSAIDYCRQAKEEMGKGGYVVGVNKMHGPYQGGHWQRSLVIDFEKLKTILDVDGFDFD